MGPRAEVMDVFQRWHVCYHGTSVDSVKTILKCGGLMIRGKDITILHTKLLSDSAKDVLHSRSSSYPLSFSLIHSHTFLTCTSFITDDKTLPEHPPVPSPPNHFHDLFKPEGYKTRQIFLSPSLHYCTHGEVYAGSQRYI